MKIVYLVKLNTHLNTDIQKSFIIYLELETK